MLGLDGKFDEARQLASVDLPAANAQASKSYLRNMVSAPGNVAALDEAPGEPPGGDDWQPYAEEPEPSAKAAATASVGPPVSIWKANATAAADESVDTARVAALEPSQGGSTTESRRRRWRPALTPPAQPAVFRATVE